MKVWGTHTAGKDHLHRRAEEHIERARTRKATGAPASDATQMPRLSRAQQREVLNEQRAKGKILGKRPK